MRSTGIPSLMQASANAESLEQNISQTKGFLAVDGVGHVLSEVLVEVVHHVHHLLAHVERELLHILPKVLHGE